MESGCLKGGGVIYLSSYQLSEGFLLTTFFLFSFSTCAITSISRKTVLALPIMTKLCMSCLLFSYLNYYSCTLSLAPKYKDKDKYAKYFVNIS
jgi:hypothetical protein